MVQHFVVGEVFTSDADREFLRHAAQTFGQRGVTQLRRDQRVARRFDLVHADVVLVEGVKNTGTGKPVGIPVVEAAA